jgi:pyridoxal 5'-phosphate synthase pdxT subunit
MTVGVLALQGAFREHEEILRRMGVEERQVRRPEQLTGLGGLIIPGGESTTIGKLARAYGLIEPIREMIAAGKPVWGTCAGLVLLAKTIGDETPYVGVMDAVVRRNAFGRQVESFETDLDVPCLDGRGGPSRAFRAIFIRAPLIETVGAGVEVLARLDGGPIVAARQRNVLATSFHPELTQDTRFHQFFLDLERRRS